MKPSLIVQFLNNGVDLILSRAVLFFTLGGLCCNWRISFAEFSTSTSETKARNSNFAMITFSGYQLL
jgi:hypothetical protein